MSQSDQSRLVCTLTISGLLSHDIKLQNPLNRPIPGKQDWPKARTKAQNNKTATISNHAKIIEIRIRKVAKNVEIGTKSRRPSVTVAVKECSITTIIHQALCNHFINIIMR